MTLRLVAPFSLALTTAPALAQEAEDLLLDDIEVRHGVTADIHLTVYENADVPCRSGAILAVHGATATGNTLQPLALAALDTPFDGRPVCQVVTMDLPGHGGSPPPTGALFGDLTLEDYAAAVIGTLDRLDDEDLRPVTVVGHSMGGLVLQLTQQALLDQGSSLWNRFHVGHAILLAPAIPASSPWVFRDSGAGAGLVLTFAVNDPVLGDIFAVPPELAPAVFFGTLSGGIASTAIPVEQMLADGWIGSESMGAMSGMIGLPPYAASDVDAGLFADPLGTRLDLVAFEQDSTIFATDLELLFPHLTGKSIAEPGFLLVAGPDAVHGLPQADPYGLLDAFDGHVALP
jgi:pimeloyl-ACP methyl ester carboxylesterase